MNIHITDRIKTEGISSNIFLPMMPSDPRSKTHYSSGKIAGNRIFHKMTIDCEFLLIEDQQKYVIYQAMYELMIINSIKKKHFL